MSPVPGESPGGERAGGLCLSSRRRSVEVRWEIENGFGSPEGSPVFTPEWGCPFTDGRTRMSLPGLGPGRDPGGVEGRRAVR